MKQLVIVILLAAAITARCEVNVDAPLKDVSSGIVVFLMKAGWAWMSDRIEDKPSGRTEHYGENLNEVKLAKDVGETDLVRVKEVLRFHLEAGHQGVNDTNVTCEHVVLVLNKTTDKVDVVKQDDRAGESALRQIKAAFKWQ